MLPMQQPLLALLLLVFFVAFTSTLPSIADADTDADAGEATTYIVYLNPTLKPSPYATHLHWHHAHLASLSLDPSRHLLYSYTTAAPSAFAARLLPSHAAALRSHPAVAWVHEDALLPLHTTRSPSFLHLPPYDAPEADAAGPDVIIGVLDTGVWPESPSFADAGLGPVPPRWRGTCDTNATDFPSSMCNRKLIGAQSFFRGYSSGGGKNGSRVSSDLMSPRDHDGHGTHTATTAAGAVVSDANLLGYAPGTARGMAPGARVAAYKVCWRQGCFTSDILAGMEKAIDDGVDVLSLSLGGGTSLPLSRDPIAVGALAATRRGIIVSCSAGNSGPSPSSLVNTAPWIITVGAGTLDRTFPAYAVLGNGESHAGMSLYAGDGLGDAKYPLVYNKGIRAGSNASKLCMEGTLNAEEVKGKVVLCDRGVNSRVEKGQVVKQAGGVGMVLANTPQSGEEVVADSHLLPAVAVGAKSGDAIRSYVESDTNAEVALTFAGTELDVRPAPVVAAFSSRGPNRVVPQLLKPDVIGPGVNILAGWTGSLGPTGLAADERRSAFNILSGTSMSCPHISGLAAFVKAAHPDWSPSAVKSALMTTTYTVDNTGSPLLDAATNATATPWAYGAGHVDPVRALSPGLVYDASPDDYVAFLCTVGVSPRQVQAIVAAVGPNVTCARKLSSPGDLNYPSFSVVFGRRSSRSTVKYRRELTNVGDAGATYTAKVTGPSDISVSVKPARLEFRRTGDKLRYTVTFRSANARGPMDPSAFGWLTWSSGENEVRSPISYTWGV
nr:unnamed protein product [Digitaria exilis]